MRSCPVTSFGFAAGVEARQDLKRQSSVVHCFARYFSKGLPVSFPHFNFAPLTIPTFHLNKLGELLLETVDFLGGLCWMCVYPECWVRYGSFLRSPRGGAASELVARGDPVGRWGSVQVKGERRWQPNHCFCSPLSAY